MSILACEVGKKETMLRRNGIRGTRSHIDGDARKGPQHIGGTIRLEPSYAELVALMSLAIGSGGNTSETIPSFNTVVDRYERVDTYTGCKVNRATITGQQGGIINVQLDVIGQTEVQNTGSVAAPNSGVPFIFSDLALNLANAVQEAFSFQLVIDNHIDPERFLNSLTLSQTVELDRTVTLQTVHPYNDTTVSLYDQAVQGSAGTLALNNGTNTGTFSFGTLQVPAESPHIPGKTEVQLTLNMQAASNTAANTKEIAFA
jgi:hypothetical protein